MPKILQIVLLASGLLLSACQTTQTQNRMMYGLLIGAGVGALGANATSNDGNIGAAAGALIGAGAGYATQ
ncbi:MAG: hypothetical protein GY804_03320 [Alphaproteobacteria bacterium]|nr:hypothetical protein [Alphaproteobacteria bacterium]